MNTNEAIIKKLERVLNFLQTEAFMESTAADNFEEECYLLDALNAELRAAKKENERLRGMLRKYWKLIHKVISKMNDTTASTELHRIFDDMEKESYA